jgi:putative protease
MYILARTMEQLEAAVGWSAGGLGVDRPMVYCELEDVRRYPDAVKLAHRAGAAIALATVRIIKPTEHGLLRQVAAAEPDAILIRNLAGLAFFSEHCPTIPLIADYALNVANELTAAILAAHNVERITSSYDLTWKQLAGMLGRFTPSWFEVVIHQHMPMFHMEHCVFAHALSNGKDYRDCGRPCDRHAVDLRDRAAVSHPLIADVGCRNTVYNGTAQSAAEFVPRMLTMGIRHFRIELLRESGAAATTLLDRYARVLAGADDGRQTWRQLRVLNQLGVTRGTME